MYSPSRPTSTSPTTSLSASTHGAHVAGQHSHVAAPMAATTMSEHVNHRQPTAPLASPHSTTAEHGVRVLNSINRVSRMYYSKKEQAIIYSARHPGVSLHRQADMRRESCEILAALGRRIGFPQHTISTAQLLLHRFFMFHSVPDSGNEVVMACLFVSCKVEDTIKKLKDIMTVTYTYRHPEVSDWDPESKEGEEQRKRVLSYEKLVLESICFDFRITHPYKYIIKFVKLMNGSKALARQGWDIARQSYKTGVCLEYPPHAIAAGSIYLASKLIAEPFPELVQGEPWTKALRTRQVDVEGRSDEQQQVFTSIQIALNEARSMDLESHGHKSKRMRTEYIRPISVQAGKWKEVC
ncbi:hypothetical protein BGW38_004019 [Lunasporangiospora selenospora]|uniref:Cyclin-like domain-containing protein n=1 Tax=Lunasporangiospora selenospora TaxID=979761 RepID=A0A9P6FQM9_9FUNG|nr:hypothetical protein BGW38_004019 [Lunasporangiospora selenospora]